jgi:hypothetical protein
MSTGPSARRRCQRKAALEWARNAASAAATPTVVQITLAPPASCGWGAVPSNAGQQAVTMLATSLNRSCRSRSSHRRRRRRSSSRSRRRSSSRSRRRLSSHRRRRASLRRARSRSSCGSRRRRWRSPSHEIERKSRSRRSQRGSEREPRLRHEGKQRLPAGCRMVAPPMTPPAPPWRDPPGGIPAPATPPEAAWRAVAQHAGKRLHAVHCAMPGKPATGISVQQGTHWPQGSKDRIVWHSVPAEAKPPHPLPIGFPIGSRWARHPSM